MTSANAPTSLASLETLTAALAEVLAPWVQQIGLRVIEARAGEVVLTLPITPPHVHAGGVLCGQTLMAACDSAMVLAVITRLGSMRPMTTVQLQTSFMRAIPGDSGSARIVARVLRMGRKLVFGVVQVFSADGELAAHATTTYALL